MNVLSILLLVIKIVGKVIDNLDAKGKAEATKALLDAGRLRLEDDVIAKGVSAYNAALAGGGRVRDNDPYARD